MFFILCSSMIIKSLSHLLEAKGWDSKEGIIAIYVSDAQPEDFVTAEYLRSIEEIVESVWGYIIDRRSPSIQKSSTYRYMPLHRICVHIGS